MIQRATLLGYPDRVAAHLDDKCLGHRSQYVRRSDPEGAFLKPGEIDTRAGEGHHRVQGEWQRTNASGRLEDLDAVTAARMAPELPGVHVARLGQAGDHRGKRIIGNCDEDEIRISRYCRDIEDGHPW